MVNQCWECNKGFAVNAAGTACVGFTTDYNCRKINEAGTPPYCTVCKENYCFSLNECSKDLERVILNTK